MAKATTKAKDPRAVLLEKAKKNGVTVSSEIPNVQRVPSGSARIDEVTGGGYPVGMVTQFSGYPNSGKTTLALIAALKALMEGKRVFYVVGEHRIDPSWWAKLGLPWRQRPDGTWECFLKDDLGYPMMEIVSGDNAEVVLQTVKDYLESRLFGLCIFDGITNIPTLNESQSEMTKATQMGGSSKVLTRFFRAYGQYIESSGCAVLVINQIRDNVDSQTAKYKPTTTPGGWALKHAISLHFEMMNPKADFLDKETREVLTALIFRMHMGKSSICNYMGGEINVVLARDLETDTFAVDTISEVYTLAKDAGVLLNKDGDTHEKGGVFIDVQRGMQFLNIEKLPEPYNELKRNTFGHLALGNGQAAVIETIRKIPLLSDIIYALIKNSESKENNGDQADENMEDTD